MATDYTQYLANRKLNIAEQKQQNIQKAHEQAVLAEQQRQAQLQKEVEEKNTLERVGETALDFLGTLGKGLFGLGEGVVDAGAAIGGFVGGIFGADTDWAEDFISFNATEEWIGKNLDNATKGSYMNDTFVEDVVEGIGQMLPTIGLMVAAPFTGGATLAGVPYTVGATVASAGGKGVEEALGEDAEFNQAFGYGLINAGIEGLIEYATAGMGKGITSIGKSVGKDTAKSAAKSLGKVVLEEAASEAIEEGLTEFLNPLAKGVTYKDFDEEMKRYGDAQLYKDTGYAALVGGTVGGITAGAGGIAGRVNAGGKSGYSIQQSVSEISTLDKKSDNLFNRGKIDAESIQTIRNQQQAELNNISTQLKQMTSEQRIETIKKYNLNKQFNESGDIISNTQTNSNNKPLISAETNIEAYTPSLVNTDLKLAPTTSVVSEASKSAKQIVTTLDSNMRVVITDADVYNGSKFNAFYDQDSRVVYLNNKSTKTDVMKAVAVHELTHSLEGTKQYNEFSKYVKDMFSVEEWNSMLANKVNQYSKVNQAVKSGELGDVVAIREAETEIIAEYAGELLSNEQSIKRIATQNASLAVRVYEWIKQTIGKLTKKSGIKGEEYNFLRKAEKLYADALKNSVGGYSLSEFKQNIENRLKESKKIKADEKTNTETADARYSLNTDSQGNKLSSEQIEFFKDSKVRDENGRLLPVYHVSPNSFTIFDKNKIGSSTDYGAFGRGFYFGTKKWSNYGIYEYNVYLNIKNPLTIEGGENAYNFRKQVLELAGKGEYDNITAKDMSALTQSLIRDGYDGVIFKSDFNHTENEYIAFESNQIKNTDNKTPTKNEDIRFSLKDPVEYSKDLVAIHNLSPSKLLDTLELGGLAMPSIAIIKDGGSHNAFGSVSLILKPDAIDPRANYDNKVYSADAYTSRFPQVDYSLNEAKLSEFAKNIGDSYYSLEANEFDKGKNRESIIDSLKQNVNHRKKFVSDFNIKVEKVLQQPNFSYSVYHSIKEYLSQNIPFDSLVNNNSVREGLISTIREAYKGKNYPTSFAEKTIEKINNRFNDAKTDTELYNKLKAEYELDVKIAKGEAPLVETTYSYEDGLNNAIKDNMERFTKYTAEIVDSILAKKYLRNNKSYYNNSGNPRTFAQLHEPFTAENAVRLMREAGSKNSEGNGIFGIGIGEIKAALSKDFWSISEMHQEKYKISDESDISKEMYEKATKDLAALAEDMSKYSRADNPFERNDIARQAIYDVVAKTKTDESAKRYIKKEYLFDITSNDIARIRKLAKDIDALPVKYFEAKPERVVSFDEVSAAIIPSDSPDVLKNILDDVGIKYHEYQVGDEKARLEILNNLEDVRFNLSDGEGDYKYSKGQISKYIAEHSKPKSYAKVDAEKVINTIVNNTLTFGDKYGEIANKTKNQVVDMFWHSLNTRDEGYRAKAVLDIADYLIENSVAESIYKGDVDSESASYIVNNLRPYLRKIDLTSLKGEIAHKYDTDKSVYARWGKRKGTQGIGVDTISQDLIDSGIQINATNDADIFFEIDQMYRDSLAQLKSKTKESLSKVGSAEEISQLRQTIARELLNAWDDVGKKTKFQTTIDKYTGRISTLKNALKEVKATNKITNQIIDVAREARDIVKRNYKESAGILKDDRVKAMMKIVSGFNRANSTIIAGDIRNKISQLSSVYTQNNLGQFSTDTEFGAINSDFDPNIRDAIDFLMNNKSTTLTSEELKALRIVSKGILHLYKNYDKMTYQGKLQEVSAVAESGMGVVERTARMKSKNGVFSKMFDSVNKKFLINATDPLTAITSMEGYDSNGVITQSMLTVMEGDTNAQVAYADLMMPFEEFYKNNKKYRKRLNELVSVNTDKGEIKITVNEAAALYGWAQREQSNIYIEGFKVTAKDGSSETYFITPTDIDNLYDSLTDADKKFIELARKMFNEQARDMKVKTDEQLKGYSVIEETNWYIPIKRDQSQLATELGSVKGYIQDFATADNMSFNKATIRGARGALRLQNMTSLVESHARGVSTYYGLAVPLKNFNKVWNKRILVGDKLVSIKEVVHDKIWSGGNEYLGKFFNDLQGVRKGGQNRLLNKMRGSYAKFQLAFNVGTVLKQTASFGMAYTYLDVGSLARGLAMKADIDTMFKYAPITKARMFDRSVVKAQGLIDKLGTASDTMTKPIQLMDNAVVHKLWNASQVQVQKDMGHKIGTEQNLVEAGKLLEKVVRETQSNSITSERSAMSRSDSFLVSSFTMFMSDAQKQFSRLYESVGKVNALKWRIKNGEAGLQQEYKQARKKLNRSLTGVTMSALIVAMVNKFMRWLLGREDKDNFWEGLGSDMIGQFFGLLPIVRDFYGYLTDDYEINNYALGMINDSADAIKGIWTVSEKLISGQYVAEHEINKPVRNLLYTFGQFTGIPFRNMYNLYYGVLDKFSPSEALKLKSLFYGNNGYSAALKDAVDKGDLRNADKIVALMLEDKTGKVRDDNVIETTRHLVSQGYNPMPKSLNKKITYNSEEINLTARQHAEFSKIYEQSNDVIKSMVNSSRFERLDDSAKARAMKMVYDYYYNLGLENLIGESLDNKAMLFASGISIDQLAMAVAQAQTYEANVDKLGNVITGSKKYKIQQFINSLKLSVAQKYMIMGYLGYSNKNGAGIVKTYVNRLKLSKDEKQELYLMSGYKQ